MASWHGEVQAVFGVAEYHEERPEGMPRVGVPWLLCARPPAGIWFEFMRRAEEIMARWRRAFPALVGSVDAERTRARRWIRSEEHTSELQSLMRISYAVFCLKKKN